MRITIPTPEIINQFNACVDLAIAFINDFKEDGNREKFINRLNMVVMAKPNISYLDPDILEIYGIESENSQWIECNAEEIKDDNEALFDIIKNDDFEPYRLSTGSSGSILISIFGDAYYQMRKFK